PPSLRVLRDLIPAGAETGIAALASPPGLSRSVLQTGLVPSRRDVHQQHEVASERAEASPGVRSLPAAALTAAEQFASPLGRMNLGGSQGLALLGREFAHTDHPLAMRPLPEVAHLLSSGA